MLLIACMGDPRLSHVSTSWEHMISGMLNRKASIMLLPWTGSGETEYRMLHPKPEAHPLFLWNIDSGKLQDIELITYRNLLCFYSLIMNCQEKN